MAAGSPTSRSRSAWTGPDARSSTAASARALSTTTTTATSTSTSPTMARTRCTATTAEESSPRSRRTWAIAGDHHATTAVWGDYDNDGRPDVYVASYLTNVMHVRDNLYRTRVGRSGT